MVMFVSFVRVQSETLRIAYISVKSHVHFSNPNVS